MCEQLSYDLSPLSLIDFFYTSDKFMMSQHFWQSETRQRCVLGVLSI